MTPTIRSLAIAGAIAAVTGLGTDALAQAQPPAARDPAAGTAPSVAPSPNVTGSPAARGGGEAASNEERRRPPMAAAPLAGANSFTEGQVRGRLEDAGLTDVAGLEKDEHGVWRGRASQAGSQTDVAVDFRGNVVVGAGAARGSLAAADRPAGDRAATGTGTAAGRATEGGNAPDGTAGNPPSTMTGRAVDRAQGETPRPDGTPGNPPGTAAGRAADRALGTNSTGANPGAANPPAAGGGPAR